MRPAVRGRRTNERRLSRGLVTDRPTAPGRRRSGNPAPLSSKLFIDILRIQFEYVIIVIEEVQSPVGTSPYEIAPHRLKLCDGSLENFRCGLKGNMVPGPGALNGRANQHNPGACQSDERFDMTVFVLALDRSGAEEVVKERGRPGRVLYYEGYVANRFDHVSPRQTCSSMIRSEESVR